MVDMVTNEPYLTDIEDTYFYAKKIRDFSPSGPKLSIRSLTGKKQKEYHL